MIRELNILETMTQFLDFCITNIKYDISLVITENNINSLQNFIYTREEFQTTTLVVIICAVLLFHFLFTGMMYLVPFIVSVISKSLISVSMSLDTLDISIIGFLLENDGCTTWLMWRLVKWLLTVPLLYVLKKCVSSWVSKWALTLVRDHLQIVNIIRPIFTIVLFSVTDGDSGSNIASNQAEGSATNDDDLHELVRVPNDLAPNYLCTACANIIESEPTHCNGCANCTGHWHEDCIPESTCNHSTDSRNISKSPLIYDDDTVTPQDEVNRNSPEVDPTLPIPVRSYQPEPVMYPAEYQPSESAQAVEPSVQPAPSSNAPFSDPGLPKK